MIRMYSHGFLCTLLMTLWAGHGLTKASAAVLVEYHFASNGSPTVPAGLSDSVSASNWTATGVTSLVFGGGVASADEWSTSSSNDFSTYFEFTIESASNFETFNLDEFTFTEDKVQNGQSPKSFEVTINGVSVISGSTSNSPTSHEVVLSGFADLQNIESANVRIYGFKAIGREWLVSNVSLEGTVMGTTPAIPEPHEYTVVASLVLLISAILRRRKLQLRSSENQRVTG